MFARASFPPLVRIILVCMFVWAFVLPHEAAHAAAGDRISVGKGQWLNGLGVDVIYPPSSPVPYVPERYGLRYECVELVQRLYSQLLGYPEKWFVNAKDMPSVVGKPGFGKLHYYKNGDTTPPRPGDVLVRINTPDGHGHVAIANQLAGNEMQYVQQNGRDYQGNPWPVATIRIYRTPAGGFSLDRFDGWIHSDLMDQYLIKQPSLSTIYNTDMQWNQDGNTIYVYVSQGQTRRMAQQGAGVGSDVATMLAGDPRRILGFTSLLYAQCVSRRVAVLVQSDGRFNNQDVRSVDYTIKYAGNHLWARPWGGTANGQWIDIPGITCGLNG